MWNWGRPSTTGLGVFGHLPVQLLTGTVVGVKNGIKVTHRDAPPAAHALFLVNKCLTPIVGDSVLPALLDALAAACAALLLHHRLSAGVLLHLAPAAPAPHANIFQRTAEPGLLMALEVAQADEHICVHDGAADLSLLHILAPRHRDLYVIIAPQAVSNDDLTAGGEGGKPVLIGALNVLQGIFPPPRVEGVAVRQKGNAAQLLHHIRHRLGVVRPQISQVPGFSEVELDGHQLFSMSISPIPALRISR